MTATADLPFLNNLPTVELNPMSSADVNEKNGKAILDFIDWVNENKGLIYFNSGIHQAFFDRLQSALLEVYPEKPQEIKSVIDTVSQDIEKQNWKEGWPPLSQLMGRIIGTLVGDSKRQYRERIGQYWNSEKENAPIAAVIRTFVQENQSSQNSYSRENLPESINYSFTYNSSDGWFSYGESDIIVLLMLRLGFNYVSPSEKTHFLIDRAVFAPQASTTLLTSSQKSKIPVLLLPASGSTSIQSGSSSYDKSWLLGVLRALNRFLGMPELSDEEPANHADGMASSDRHQESLFNIPELKGLLEGQLSLSPSEEPAYIAQCLIRNIDVRDIRSRLFRLATEMGMPSDFEYESRLKRQEISDGVEAIFAKEAEYFTPEMRWRIADEAMNQAEKWVDNPKKITWEIVEPLVRQGIIQENRQRSGNSGTQEDTLLALIKDAVPAFQVMHVRESIDQFVTFPRIIYGQMNSIAVNDFNGPFVFGISNAWPGYAQSDGLVRVYTYAFVDTPRVDGFGRSEKGDDFRHTLELIAMTDEQKSLIRSVLDEIESFAAIRFRKATEGEDIDFDFAAYRNDDRDTTPGRLAFMNGELPYRRIRFGDESTFGKDTQSILGIIRHEIAHALGLDHRNELINDMRLSVMSQGTEVFEYQSTDKLTIQLIHGRNPELGTSQQLFREAQKVWLAPGSWAAQITLNAQDRLNEDYAVTGFVQGESVLRFFSASDRTTGFHRGIAIDALNDRTWRIHFKDDADTGKTVLIIGMESLAFSDLQVEILYADGSSYQLQSDNSAGLKWVGHILQGDKWITITDIDVPSNDHLPLNTESHDRRQAINAPPEIAESDDDSPDASSATLQKQQRPEGLLVDAIAGFQDSSSADVYFPSPVTGTCSGITPCITFSTVT